MPVHVGVRSEDAAVDKLLQRVSDGILPDDRREALVQLRDLLTGNPQVRCNSCLSRTLVSQHDQRPNLDCNNTNACRRKLRSAMLGCLRCATCCRTSAGTWR